MNTISFLSDFGVGNGYTGIVKGIILSINPEARVIDISHHIVAYNIEQASYMIETYYTHFPQKTVHLAVVDPGVGSTRNPVIMETANYYFVGPDNGIFTRIYQREAVRYYKISIDKLMKEQNIITSVSATFHARDIFAPVCALLSMGILPKKIADKTDMRPVVLSQSLITDDNVVTARVIAVDDFGNIITNYHREEFEKYENMRIEKIVCRKQNISSLLETYSDAAKGQIMALWGSSGLLEISVNQGNAARRLGCRAGKDKVEIFLKSD